MCHIFYRHHIVSYKHSEIGNLEVVPILQMKKQMPEQKQLSQSHQLRSDTAEFFF